MSGVAAVLGTCPFTDPPSRSITALFLNSTGAYIRRQRSQIIGRPPVCSGVTELLPVDQKSRAPCLAPTELAIDDTNHGDVPAARASRYACDDRGVVDESALAPARPRLPQDHAVFP